MQQEGEQCFTASGTPEHPNKVGNKGNERVPTRAYARNQK